MLSLKNILYQEKNFHQKPKQPLNMFFLSLLEHQLKMICICLNKGLLKIVKSTMNGTNNNAQSLTILVWYVYLKVRRHTQPNSNIIFCNLISILILMNTNSVQYQCWISIQCRNIAHIFSFWHHFCFIWRESFSESYRAI